MEGVSCKVRYVNDLRTDPAIDTFDCRMDWEIIFMMKKIRKEKDMKIKTIGNQMFSIPNNKEGKQFIKLAHKFLNYKVYRTWKLGRGKRKQFGYKKHDYSYSKYQSKIPISKSEWIAWYIVRKDGKTHDEATSIF